MNRQRRAALLLSASISIVPVSSVAQQNSSDETIDFYESNKDNAKYFTLDTAIPTAPGLVLAGASAFDDIGHNLGSDLTYEFGISESGVPQIGVSMRPYWSIFRALRSSKTSFDDYNSNSGRGAFHWLKRTQVSIGLASTKKDKVEQVGAGLGFLFYPLNGPDPRSDTELASCLKGAVDKAFPNVQETIETTSRKVSSDTLTKYIQNVELEADDLLLDDPNVRQVYQDDVIEISGEPRRLKPDTHLNDVSFNFEDRKRVDELRALMRDLIAERGVDEGSVLSDAILADFDRKLNLRRKPEPSDSQINSILNKVGVSNPEFKRSENPPDGYLGIVEQRIRNYLSDLPVSDRPSEETIDLIVADFQEKMQRPDIRKSLSKSYVNALLRTWLIEDADMELPDPPVRTLSQEVEKYLTDRGNVPAQDVQLALAALEAEIERRLTASIEVADINDFLTSHGLKRWNGPARDITQQVASYLRDSRSDVSDAGQTRISQKVSAAVNKEVNLQLQSSTGFASAEIKKCRKEATDRYLGKRELVFGVGVAAKSPDDSFDNLKLGGVSVWGRYRIPIFLSGKVDDKGKPKAPDGELALFSRFVEDDKILVAESQFEDAQTWILGATAAAERENMKFSLSFSYNDRDIASALIEDQEFWRVSVGWSRRLNDRIWLETEFGEILKDAPFNEGAFGRVGLRFDGGLKF